MPGYGRAGVRVGNCQVAQDVSAWPTSTAQVQSKRGPERQTNTT
jgi:hypothetical protein